MRKPTFEVTCSVCGCVGVGDIRTAGAEWVVGNLIAHNDPNVCRRNLERKQQEKDKK